MANRPDIDVIEVDGGVLHVERRGSGPALPLIAGGGGDAGS
ncbi:MULTISPECIES: hypothetical protein [Actinoalloteichus]|uniref:Uncharacterized protein n=1 Tax=Actinoalloteichus fjordicus TaxID=1612552 RepID=A0AAC9LET5_9PSEU|nr:MULTISPECIES: hypothetical protein [Actinoalloteichus]APU16076.1 hypothetical protein UA74_20255 [Actinoalloteichus fjordicus]APU22141.1 hypothetical protein UA75_20760 [Actinoalloteichus sp. GBA129-24]